MMWILMLLHISMKLKNEMAKDELFGFKRTNKKFYNFILNTWNTFLYNYMETFEGKFHIDQID